MRIRFLRDELFENLGRLQGHLFREGEEYDLPEDHANRWVTQGAAELLDPPEGFKPVARRRRARAEGDTEISPLAESALPYLLHARDAAEADQSPAGDEAGAEAGRLPEVEMRRRSAVGSPVPVATADALSDPQSPFGAAGEESGATDAAAADTTDAAKSAT